MRSKYNLFIAVELFSVLTRIDGSKLKNATRTDLEFCKVSQFGTEYRGRTYETSGGIRCQFWHGEDQLHDVNPALKDGDFPEQSMRFAKNYCRNPTGDARGPWCYTTDPSLIDDECGIPLCNFGECRITGGGAEYGGSRETSSSGRKCKSWNKRYKTVNGKTEKFSNRNYPESSKEKAKNYCRNPDDNPGGPWCYVEEEDYELVEREYCDVPFCDDRDCLVYTRNSSTYSTITSMNSTAGNMTIWVKLWDPDDEIKGEARLFLSLLPIPTSPKILADDWRAGSDLLISNSGSGQIHPGFEDDDDLEPTPSILRSTNWTGLSVTWGGGFISVSLLGSVKPIFIDEYGKKNTISGLYENSFFYYGLMGTGVLWSTDYCLQSCEIHTTYGMDFQRIWPFQRSNTTYDIAFENSQLLTLSYQESEKSGKQQLTEVSSSNLLDFWIWKHFTISIFGPHLRLFSEKHYGNEEILYAKEHVFSTLRWFSIGSEDVIAHWALYCAPGEDDAVEVPSPPNCLSNPRDYLYQGTQWISEEGEPCVPWISKDASNKCRNPGHDPKGPYCYTKSSSGLKKKYCSIRGCRSSECRTAGTANDYIGTLSVTRSGRTCAVWVVDEDEGGYLPGGPSSLGKIQKRKRNVNDYEDDDRLITLASYPDDLPEIKSSSTGRSTPSKGSPDNGEDYEDDNVLITMPKYLDGLPEKSSSSTEKTTPSTRKTTVKETTTKRSGNFEEDYEDDNVLITMPQFLNDLPEKSSSSTEKRIPSTQRTTIKKTTTGRSKNLEEDYEDDDVLITMPQFLNDLPEKSSSSTEKTTSSKKTIPSTQRTTIKETTTGRSKNLEEDYEDNDVLITMPQFLNDLPEKSSSTTERTIPSTQKTTLQETTAERTTETTTKISPTSTTLKQTTKTTTKAPLTSTTTESPTETTIKPTTKSFTTPSSKNEYARRPNDGIPREHFNETLFPEQNARNASNYCRDPSRNIAGAWCYTTDPDVPQDLCDVPDCDKSDDCISLVKGQESKRKFYIFPEHRSEGLRFALKAWEPDNPDSITFTFSAEDGIRARYILKVGAMNNEKVLLYRQLGEKSVELLKKKTLPHLLYLGKWSSFVIKIPRGKIQVFYEESPNALFEWEDPEPAKAFLPVYYSFASELGNTIGVSFDCLSHNAINCDFLNNSLSWIAIRVPRGKYRDREIYEDNPDKIEDPEDRADDQGDGDIDGDPIDGGWSEWSPWACSASCNGGVGTRKRHCNNPEPNVKGEPCMGPSAMTGTCNTILCGDITEDTVTMIKRRARRNHTSLVINEGQGIVITADSDVIDAITRESPDSEINWSHNGIFIHPDERRVQIIDHDIVIKRSEVNDSGVYTITLHRLDGTHMILKLVSLGVLPVRTILTLRETLPMTVVCRCVVIGYQYNDLRITWSINNRMWKDYGITHPISVNVDQIPAVNKTHRGLWRCVVRQDDLGFTWTTNSIFVNVIGPPNWRTHLMEDRLTRPIFGWMPSEQFVAASAFVIFFLLTASIISGTIVYLRFQRSLEGAMSSATESQRRLNIRTEKTPTRKKVFDRFQNLSIRKTKRERDREKLLPSSQDE
nr:PREDICTED: uncharacterized protein LOC105270904 [Fopius arisanus]